MLSDRYAALPKDEASADQSSSWNKILEQCVYPL
jgi:hypothetical protein